MSIESFQTNNLSPNDLWTIGVAAYAAIISTFVLGWDVYKWLSTGAKIDISASTSMKVVGGTVEDQNTYIIVTAFNMGDRPTTITNLGAMYFESWWCAYITKRKPKEVFIVTTPSQAQPIPFRLEVGAQWIGKAIQTDDIEEKAKNGYLFLILYTADIGRGHRVRITKKEENNSE